jgi:hypothetical protein
LNFSLLLNDAHISLRGKRSSFNIYRFLFKSIKWFVMFGTHQIIVEICHLLRTLMHSMNRIYTSRSFCAINILKWSHVDYGCLLPIWCLWIDSLEIWIYLWNNIIQFNRVKSWIILNGNSLGLNSHHFQLLSWHVLGFSDVGVRFSVQIALSYRAIKIAIILQSLDINSGPSSFMKRILWNRLRSINITLIFFRNGVYTFRNTYAR